MHKKQLLMGTGLALALATASAASAQRQLPKPRPEHPGNVFLAGEEIAVTLPSEFADWGLVDYDGQLVKDLPDAAGKVTVGKLPVGFYRFERVGASNWVSLGVLAPLRAPTPTSSPIALDVAMAWFYKEDKMDAVANLCALAGVNWVRDRLYWAEIEPRRGEFAGRKRYDASAGAQARAGLQVLQVIHASPAWANPNGKRFPLDLRDAHRFFEAMAKRWRGQVLAFEPWNEADIPMFGGHTGAEMASLQKAAYLGLKAGNSNIVACLNVFALHNTNQLADLHANEAWPYFDTYNLHHYEAFDNYPKLYADHRAASAGRPLWVTECAVPVKWAGDEQLKEPTDADLKVQAERVAKTFACSLHEGVAATYYFLLPHYVEGQTQFGILRPDLTPRPAFVALAAVGRLLADAHPLGRLRTDAESIRAFLFQARPDGEQRPVLVAWSAGAETTLTLPAVPRAIFDHLGRERDVSLELRLTSAPMFALLPAETSEKFVLTPPPSPPAALPGKPSPIVLQALWPEERLDLKRSAYQVSATQPETIPLFAYNFGAVAVRGTLRVSQPEGWSVGLPEQLELAPGERKELALTVDGLRAKENELATLRLDGDFGASVKAVLSLRLTTSAPQ
jgi:hypothetical protein